MSCFTHILSNERRAGMKLRLRDLREEQNLSQTEMAKKLGVSQQTYSRYETHTSDLPLEKLVWLAEYFKVTTDYLLGISEQRQRT